MARMRDWLWQRRLVKCGSQHEPSIAEEWLPSMEATDHSIHHDDPWSLKSTATAPRDKKTQENTEYDWIPDDLIDRSVMPEATLTATDDLIDQNLPEPTKPVNSGTRLLDWYQNCLDHHPECRSIFDASHQPTRLLDIGQSYLEPVRLVTFSTEDMQPSSPTYATLSHCWGTSQPLRLLSSNLPQFQEGIARERIPRVFSEAIELMGIIYSRAIINIGATGSTGCNDKLFNSTDKAPSVGLISWERNHEPPARYVVVENAIEWTKSFMNQPLLQRAWVMQERFLATRMVHFTKSQVVWECRTTAATETYPVRVPDALWPFHDRRNRFWREDFIEDDGAWSVLVGNYSKCSLTFGKDKLVALSGLVSALEATGLARGRYWAGMWEADLPYNLLWTRGAIDPSNWCPARPSTYRAPSWSWASLDYPIWTEWSSGTSESPLVSHWKVKEEKGPSFAASLLLYCALSLHMDGPLVRAEVQVKKPWVEAIGRGIERVQGISYSIARIDGSIALKDDAWNDVVFDDFDDANLHKEIWCAPIYECEEWIDDAEDEKRLLGLLLRAEDHGTFRRIGAFSVGNWADQQVLKRLQKRKYTVV
ncbi:hypothetical protein P171DRAFT_476965 [Karstenula rhodostoma CBS 690.94]|uniref:Heterokaryon incompatibility domain-containing protein n=1 Tax=Karstenula rhodostoma CBS 690.94 TaxID=1392251 RepID=A0A9P4P8I3_9PLEO|nr:hypothetical protein P171DRAFT_476965 [Karstenula rhodostoma CBS 690.94]